MFKRGLRYVDELSGAVRSQLAIAYRAKDLIGYGIRQRLREGYTRADFKSDLIAACNVGALAFPLSMARATAAGAPPQYGLYTAIIAGVITALVGGTRFQVTGPTTALVVILMPILHRHGLAGLLVAGGLAGIILVLMGLARLGRFMQFVPDPVTTGFTAAIALLVGVFQLPNILGVKLEPSEGIVDFSQALYAVRSHFHGADLAIAIATVVLVLVLPRIWRKLPAPFAALVLVTIAAVIIHRLVPGFAPATLGDRYETQFGGETIRGIPPLPPLPVLPWHIGSGFSLDYQTIRELLPSAFAIAILGAIESLMAATVADGMSGTQHDPNSELIALGIANIVCPFFGGMAATGALARTTTNIRAGARSPLAAAMSCIVVLAGTLALAPLISYLPMAALAGFLVLIARNLSEARHFVRLARVAPRSDVTVMLTCFTLTVVFDMVIAVTVGIVLAALLFMRRMAVLTRITLRTQTDAKHTVPDGVRLYEVAGPLFFGAAKTAMEALHGAGDKDHTVIIAMQYVPTIDATGLVALESVLDRLFRSKIRVIFAGLTPELTDLLDRAGIRRDPGRLAFAPDVDTAVSMAVVHAARILEAA